MIENCNIGVIGSGNMGGSLISGLLKIGRDPASITAVDVRDEVLEPLRARGVKTDSDLEAAVRGQAVVVVAVKPQIASEILSLIAAEVKPSQLVVSIMAGGSDHYDRGPIYGGDTRSPGHATNPRFGGRSRIGVV